MGNVHTVLAGNGLTMVNWVILHCRFGQYRDSNFIVSKTHLLYFAKHKKRRTWNPDAIAEPSDRASKYHDKRTQHSRRPGRRVPLDVWYGARVSGASRGGPATRIRWPRPSCGASSWDAAIKATWCSIRSWAAGQLLSLHGRVGGAQSG